MVLGRENTQRQRLSLLQILHLTGFGSNVEISRNWGAHGMNHTTETEGKRYRAEIVPASLSSAPCMTVATGTPLMRWLKS